MNDELEKLKSLLYTGSLTQYGKRKLIKTYEDIIKEKDKQIDLMADYILLFKTEKENPKMPDGCCAVKKVSLNKEETKQYFEKVAKEEVEELLENSISKDRIKNKIKEKQDKINKLHSASDCVIIDDLENQISVLQELLESGDINE